MRLLARFPVAIALLFAALTAPGSSGHFVAGMMSGSLKGWPQHPAPLVGADPRFAEARLDEWQHDFSIFYALIEWPGATRPNRGVPTGSADYTALAPNRY